MGSLGQQSWIIEENIGRFENRLKAETEPFRRKVLEDLLVAEREKLKSILASRQT